MKQKSYLNIWDDEKSKDRVTIEEDMRRFVKNEIREYVRSGQSVRDALKIEAVMAGESRNKLKILRMRKGSVPAFLRV